MPAIGAYADLHAAQEAAAGDDHRGLRGRHRGAGLGRAAATCGSAVAAIVISNVFYSYGESLTAAFLPELARPDSMGRVSGWGWSFGYFGGMLSLGLCLAYVLWAQARGLPATEFVPVTMLITAAVYGVRVAGDLRAAARTGACPAWRAIQPAPMARRCSAWPHTCAPAPAN